jgi:hypothetical protein
MMEPDSAGGSHTVPVQEGTILAFDLSSGESLGVATATVDGVVACLVRLILLTLKAAGLLTLARLVWSIAAPTGHSYSPRECRPR